MSACPVKIRVQLRQSHALNFWGKVSIFSLALIATSASSSIAQLSSLPYSSTLLSSVLVAIAVKVKLRAGVVCFPAT